MIKVDVRHLSVLCVFLAPLGLSACDSLPDMSRLGGNYKPVTEEVAQIAAPSVPAGGIPPLLCRAGNGTARFGGAWLDFATKDFSLLAGHRVEVTLSPKKSGKEMSFQGYYDPSGQKIIFCPVKEAPAGTRIACASLYVLEDDLRAGIKRTLDIPEAVRGGELTCAFAKESLRKL